MIRKLMMGAGLAALATTALAAGHGAMGDKDMTRDDIVAKVRDHFAKMDANKDGAVSTDEMKNIHEMRMAKHDGDKPHDVMMMMKHDPNEMFDKLDANKDGSISRDEFAKGHEMRIEKRIEIREKMKDAKGDHVMRMHHGGPGMHMMGMADSDKDGKITLAEAEAMALKHFDEMDANKDGKVTADERKAARPMIMKMREIHTEKASSAS